MPVEHFTTCVFCLIDDLYISLVTRSLRKSGTPLKLSNSKAIAIEITGEWPGFHGDKDIWKYFKQHWSHLFLKLPNRSQFVRQTANLWAVKQPMHQHLAKLLGVDIADIRLVDGFPMDVCVTTRAKNSTIYNSEAAYGYCAAKKKSFYGFQGQLNQQLLITELETNNGKDHQSS